MKAKYPVTSMRMSPLKVEEILLHERAAKGRRPAIHGLAPIQLQADGAPIVSRFAFVTSVALASML